MRLHAGSGWASGVIRSAQAELCGGGQRGAGGPELARRTAFYATLLSDPSVSKSVLFAV